MTTHTTHRMSNAQLRSALSVEQLKLNQRRQELVREIKQRQNEIDTVDQRLQDIDQAAGYLD